MTEEAEEILFRLVTILDDLDSRTMDSVNDMFELAKEARRFLARNPNWKPRIRCPLCGAGHDAVNKLTVTATGRDTGSTIRAPSPGDTNRTGRESMSTVP